LLSGKTYSHLENLRDAWQYIRKNN
jgi:hypothetical protein